MVSAFDIFYGFIAGVWDPFNHDAVFALGLFSFLFIFSYFALREHDEHVLQTSLYLCTATMLIALILAFMQVPSFLTGMIAITSYSVIAKFYEKQKFIPWLKSFISLWIAIIIFSLVGNYAGGVYFVFVILAYFVLSELAFGRKEKKKPSEKK